MTTRTLPLAFPVTGTDPTVSPVHVDVRVGGRIGVPARTFGFDRVEPTGVGTSRVLTVGHRLQMIGVDAHPVTAKVVEFQPRWNGSAFALVDEPVRVYPLLADRDLSVAVASHRAMPRPTSRRRNDVARQAVLKGTPLVIAKLHHHILPVVALP